MALPVPEKLDGGRAIVIEDVPPGTGIADLIAAFSPFGAIQFASVGPPAVVAFETQASAAHALLVASMKSVSLLGAFREKKLQEPPPAQPAACSYHPTPGIETSPNKTTASPTEAAAPEAKTSQIEAAAPETKTGPNEAVCKEVEKYLDDITQMMDQLTEHLLDWHSRLQSSLHGQRSRRGRRPAAPETKISRTEAATAAGPKTKSSPEEAAEEILEMWAQLAAAWPSCARNIKDICTLSRRRSRQSETLNVAA